MKIISEKTHQTYNSVEECLMAEKRFDEAVAAKKAEEDRKKNERSNRRKEIHEMGEALEKMRADYAKKVSDYEKDYNCYFVGNSDEEENKSSLAFFKYFW